MQYFTEQPASDQCTASNAAVYLTTTWLLTAGSTFSCILNYQLDSKVHLTIQQNIKQPASTQCTACYSAVY